jgi:hypothetical protein
MSMTAKATDRRREASREIHSALDSLLPSLKFEEVGRLAEDLSRLAARPQIFLKVLSFARTMAEEREGGDQAAPMLDLVGGGHGELIDEGEGARRVDAVAEKTAPETWAKSELLGPEAMRERLGVSRSTLHNWRRDGRVIALRKGLRNHVYPVRQFMNNAPLGGVAEVLAMMTDPDEAWEWLVTPNTYTEGEPPLALLERGQAGAVRRAAESALDFA